MRSKKLYTVKQWARFKKTLVKENQSIKHNVDIQELMCKNFDIILIDYMTSRERKIQMIKTFFEKVKSTLQGIKSALDKLHESNQKRKTPQKRKKKIDNILNDFTMNEKEYYTLTGRSTVDDLDIIAGRGKKPNMSFLIGENSRDYSALLGRPSRKRKHQKKNVTNLEKIWGKRK